MPTLNPLNLDENGNQLHASELKTILKDLSDADPPITDVWVLSYGWNNDDIIGTQTYESWVTSLNNDTIAQQDAGYHPFYIGIYWPSAAWATAVGTVTNPQTFEVRISAEAGHDDPLKEDFIAFYRKSLDPQGLHRKVSRHDFTRIYYLMRLPNPTREEVTEFIRILAKYRAHSSSTFRRCDHPSISQTITTASVEELVKWFYQNQHERRPNIELIIDGKKVQMKLPIAMQAAPPMPTLFDTTNDGLLNFLRAFTFWTMHDRALIVGEQGLAPILPKLKANLNESSSIHLLGHSFGGRLVTAEVHQTDAMVVDTLVILLGAFSAYSFSDSVPGGMGAQGDYTNVVDQPLLKNPAVAIYSSADLANKNLYPLGMLPEFFSPHFYGMVRTPGGFSPMTFAVSTNASSNNLFDSIGAYGSEGLTAAQVPLPQTPFILLPAVALYDWGNLDNVECVNIDGSDIINIPDSQFGALIGAHNDIFHPEIFHAAISMAHRGR